MLWGEKKHGGHRPLSCCPATSDCRIAALLPHHLLSAPVVKIMKNLLSASVIVQAASDGLLFLVDQSYLEDIK